MNCRLHIDFENANDLVSFVEKIKYYGLFESMAGVRKFDSLDNKGESENYIVKSRQDHGKFLQLDENWEVEEVP